MTENKGEVVIAEDKQEQVLENEFVLARPITFEGVNYEKLALDFERLTGADIEKAEAQFIAESPQNQMTMVKEMSKGFLAIVASKAAGVNVELIRKLSAGDYTKVTMRTSVFLIGGK